MYRIDPLLFLLLIEALFILTLVSLYLYKRYKDTAGLQKKIRLRREGLIETYRHDMQELHGQIMKYQNKPGKRAGKELILDYMNSEKNFLRAIVEGLEKIDTHEGPLCEEVYNRYRGLHKGQFDKLKKATQQKNKFEQIVNSQRDKVARLLSYKDLLEEMKEKFARISDANKKLRDTLNELLPEAERSEELEKALKNFELSNRDMNMSLNTLEEENKRLSEKLDAQTNKAHKVDEMVEKHEKLLRDNAKFERRAEVAEKELKSLKFQFDTLEKEYKRLYDEMEDGGGQQEAAEQPDFP